MPLVGEREIPIVGYAASAQLVVFDVAADRSYC